MKNYDFTPEDKLAIAEYIYSYTMDILIMGDAITLIEILSAYDIIDDKKKWITAVEQKTAGTTGGLMALLKFHVSQEQRKSIMDEYMKGGL